MKKKKIFSTKKFGVGSDSQFKLFCVYTQTRY